MAHFLDSGLQVVRFDNLQLELTESVHTVVLQESIPAHIRRIILYISSHEGQIDGFVRELTFSETTMFQGLLPESQGQKLALTVL